MNFEKKKFQKKKQNSIETSIEMILKTKALKQSNK